MSKEIVEALTTGYLLALSESGDEVEPSDTWTEFGDYDINICGSDVSDDAPEGGVVAYVYPAGWKQDLPEPLFTVTKTLTQKEKADE